MGGFTSHAGVLLSPNELVSQYRCVHLPKTDANDRTHGNDANFQGQIAIKVNASFWESALKDQFKSVFFEWAIPEKNKQEV